MYKLSTSVDNTNGNQQNGLPSIVSKIFIMMCLIVNKLDRSRNSNLHILYKIIQIYTSGPETINYKERCMGTLLLTKSKSRIFVKKKNPNQNMT